MSAASSSAAVGTAAAPAASNSDKAALLAAMKQRLASLEKTVAQKKQLLQSPSNGTPTASTSPAPSPPAPVAAASAARSPLSALEQAKALLAAKLAAKEARASPSPSPSPAPSSLPPNAGAAAANVAGASTIARPAASSLKPMPAAAAAALSSLNAQARPFLPASAAASAAAGASTAAPSAASHDSAAAAAVTGKPAVQLHKPQLCRQWLTCSFGAKCRFRHPTVNTEAFFDYGGEVLLHLDAAAATVAAAVGAKVDPRAASAAQSVMPPVLLLVLALLLESGPTETGGVASIPLLQLWSDVKTQLQGCRELPANQDDLLNSMGLPTTAAVVLRAADGQPVLSTDAFRKQYVSQFSITRQGGAFLVTHRWDEDQRARLQEAIDLQKAQKAAAKLAKQKANSAAAAATPGASSSFNSAAAVAADDETRKRKRVPDAQVYGAARVADDEDDDAGESNKARRIGEAYPEDLEPQRIAAAAAAAAARAVSNSSTGAYSLDAGEFGGFSSFVRGGLVTELSLMGGAAAAAAAAPRARPSPPPAQSFNPFDDALARAIREGPRPIERAPVAAVRVVQTKRITSGKGYDMLQAHGWTAGQGLGPRKKGRIEPLPVHVRADRSGLGF